MVFQVKGTGQTKVEKDKQAWCVKVMERGKLRESERKFLRSSLGKGNGAVIAPILMIF